MYNHNLIIRNQLQQVTNHELNRKQHSI